LGRRAEGSTCRGNKGHHALNFIAALASKYFLNTVIPNKN
jgi:hypothetical protein